MAAFQPTDYSFFCFQSSFNLKRKKKEYYIKSLTSRGIFIPKQSLASLPTPRKSEYTENLRVTTVSDMVIAHYKPLTPRRIPK